MVQPAPSGGVSLTFRLGFAGNVLLGGGVPICFGQVIGPLSRWGMDAFYVSIWVALVLGNILSVVTGIAVMKRPGWWRRWVVGSSTASLVGWLVTLAIGLGYPLGLVHPRSDATGSLAPMGWTGLVFLVALTLPAWLVVRLLRDPAIRC